MIPAGGLYLAITAILLLIALGVAIPVLRDIFLDGLERRRGGGPTAESDSVESDSVESDSGEELAAEVRSVEAPEGPHAVCSDCQTPNDPGFTFCRECGERL